MPYTIACADAGMSCPASFTTETKDELFEHVMMHGSKKHPEIAADSNMGAQLEQLVRVS
jgi:predicted small metal-binding protein